MITLFLDTSHADVTGALYQGETCLAQFNFMSSFEKSVTAELAPLTQHLLDSVRKEVREIDQIVLHRGPGSFTGLRSGMAFAQGVSLGRNIPVYGLTGFEILSEGGSSSGETLYLLDTKCKSFYAGYQSKETIWSHEVVAMHALTPLLEKFSWVVSDMSCPFAEEAKTEVWQQKKTSALMLAQAFFAAPTPKNFLKEELFYLKDPITL